MSDNDLALELNNETIDLSFDYRGLSGIVSDDVTVYLEGDVEYSLDAER